MIYIFLHNTGSGDGSPAGCGVEPHVKTYPLILQLHGQYQIQVGAGLRGVLRLDHHGHKGGGQGDLQGIVLAGPQSIQQISVVKSDLQVVAVLLDPQVVVDLTVLGGAGVASMVGGVAYLGAKLSALSATNAAKRVALQGAIDNAQKGKLKRA